VADPLKPFICWQRPFYFGDVVKLVDTSGKWDAKTHNRWQLQVRVLSSPIIPYVGGEFFEFQSEIEYYIDTVH
jgi:hypothetical protein